MARLLRYLTAADAGLPDGTSMEPVALADVANALEECVRAGEAEGAGDHVRVAVQIFCRRMH